MAKPINWVMVRERCIAKTRDWRACTTYVKEYLNTAGLALLFAVTTGAA